MSYSEKWDNYVLDVLTHDLDRWNLKNPERMYDSGIQMVIDRCIKDKGCDRPTVTGIAGWLSEVPSCVSFATTYEDILAQGIKMGYTLQSTRVRYVFVQRWYIVLGLVIMSLARRACIQ
jgi:hypothetical protein